MTRWARLTVAVACLMLLGASADAYTKRYVGRGYFDESYTGVRAAIQSGTALHIVKYGVSNWVSTCFARDGEGRCLEWLQAGMRVRKGYSLPKSYYEYQKGGVYQLYEWQNHGWRTTASYELSHVPSEPGLWRIRKNGSLVLGIGTWPELTEAQAYSEATNEGGNNQMYALFNAASYRDADYLWRNFAPGDGGEWSCDSPYRLTVLYEHFKYETTGPQSGSCTPPDD